MLASVTIRDYQGPDNTLQLVNTEAACGRMLFEGVSPPRDLAPPSRVADLRLLDTVSEDSSLAIQLAWTAPGGDLDQGKGECGNKLHYTFYTFKSEYPTNICHPQCL